MEYRDAGSKKSSVTPLLEKMIREKADQKALDREVAHLKEIIDETKKIALSARERASQPHMCVQVDTIKDINQAFKNTRSFKIGAILGVLVLVVGAVAQYYGFKNTVDNNSAALVEVKDTIEGMRETQSSMEKKFIAYDVQVAESTKVVELINSLVEDKAQKKSKKRSK